MSKQHVNAQGGETVSRWKNGVEKLHEVAQETSPQLPDQQRLRRNRQARLSGGIFYCDPPYPLESRGSKHKGGDYLFDFTDADHERLAWKLHQIKGFAMVSGYDCLLMDYLYDDWHKNQIPDET